MWAGVSCHHAGLTSEERHMVCYTMIVYYIMYNIISSVCRGVLPSCRPDNRGEASDIVYNEVYHINIQHQIFCLQGFPTITQA